MALAVARAAVHDPEKKDVPNPRKVIVLKPEPKFALLTKLYQTARPRPVRINQELEERAGLIVLSGHRDHLLRTRHRRERESRSPDVLGSNLISDPSAIALALLQNLISHVYLRGCRDSAAHTCRRRVP